MLKSLCDFLITETALAHCDVILVLAGMPERKSYGLKLFQQGLAPRLLLSVARFDVRSTAALLAEGAKLIALRNETPPQERHFWASCEGDRVTIVNARLDRTGTYAELQAMAAYLASRAPARIGLISTSIHLRRVGFCCSQIPFFRGKQLSLWAVPEELSSFQRQKWWKRSADRLYLITEYAKLLGYYLMFWR